MFLNKLRSGVLENHPEPAIKRFTIPLGESANGISTKNHPIILVPETFTSKGCEMPVLNSRYQSREHSFVYVNGSLSLHEFCNKVSKVSMQDKSIISWKGSDTLFPGEPVFISKPGESEEDEGVLVSAVTNSDHGGQSILIFLCAKTLKELGRASFDSPIPCAMHGIFLPDVV